MENRPTAAKNGPKRAQPRNSLLKIAKSLAARTTVSRALDRTAKTRREAGAFKKRKVKTSKTAIGKKSKRLTTKRRKRARRATPRRANTSPIPKEARAATEVVAAKRALAKARNSQETTVLVAKAVRTTEPERPRKPAKARRPIRQVAKKRLRRRRGNLAIRKGQAQGRSLRPDGDRTGNSKDAKDQQPPKSGQPKPPSPGSKGGARWWRKLGTPTAGGLPGDRQGGTPNPNAEVPEGEAANLEYANLHTDMVLEYLKDQQENPDRELMDELGWTQDDLKAFLDRWQSLKEKAVENPKCETAARRNLERPWNPTRP